MNEAQLESKTVSALPSYFWQFIQSVMKKHLVIKLIYEDIWIEIAYLTKWNKEKFNTAMGIYILI